MESNDKSYKNTKTSTQVNQKKDKSDNTPQNKKSRGRRYYGRRRYYNKNKMEGTDSPKFKTSFKKISIVIPLFNEEESIYPLMNEIKKVMNSMEVQYEVIFIDDGSDDLSLKKIKDICRTDKRFKFISFRKNYGKSAALQMGFKQISGDAVITMDADLQDDPKEIPNLLNKLNEGYDLCSGWKKKRQDPIIKKFSSRFFNFVTRILTGIKIHDFNCGLKAYRKDVVKNLNVHGELHRYLPVLARWQGFAITEIPVKHYPTRYGKTKYGPVGSGRARYSRWSRSRRSGSESARTPRCSAW